MAVALKANYQHLIMYVLLDLENRFDIEIDNVHSSELW